MADQMQKLKKAEEEATKLVEAARQDRAKTLRKATAEADAEIAAYRENKMKELDEFRKGLSSDQNVIANLSSQTETDIEQLKKDVEANKGKVAERLLGVVSTVNLVVPEARKGIRSK
mmetsp:Transcript_17249/g.43757  ORF Transcript_17249/g.43757 Transcript_17249/m.43757 type:complete len:117 (-) Transcript_17249:49-399(-)|eukprot:CAMPEP_0202038978 /NCGR_PEP_ID=MMETSP0962-20130828/13691_1 /ASSEMBLY_ACC=CAM_ASM_000488 /TAXON_ID=4773 /ORGANISM="Schizochytrium aggregatum, Strain ATCC28209" /LENGTH=116 /DNA_ID=CAMNT_0048603171 /DNA_START=79 /DNA_END=429 /DNA_ORIENTATION=+